jgi:hypothetical protein
MSLKRIGRSGISDSSSPPGNRSIYSSSGLPGVVKNVSSNTYDVTNVSLSWSAPDSPGESNISSYSVEVIPPGGNLSISGTSASVTGLSANTAYEFDVAANNSLGVGSKIRNQRTTGAFNSATGGTTADVSNYNGTGQTWRVHTFASNGTFTVSSSQATFRALAVGGGSGGQPGSSYCVAGNPGTHGTATENQSLSLANTSYSVTVGGAGGTSNISTVTGTGAGGGTRFSSNITGSSVTYAAASGGQGACGCPGSNGGPGTVPGGAGGGGGGGGNCSPFNPGGGGPGAAGRVFVSYRTA